LREAKKAKLPPHLAKFFDKKGNLKKNAADRIKKGRKERGTKITDRTPDWMFPEEAPPGWEGTIKAMKKKKEIDNPYALAWHMYNKGMKPHIPEELGENMQSFKEVELDEMKFEVGKVYHQDTSDGPIYFKAVEQQKNKRWKGLVLDIGQKKPKNGSADEKLRFWQATPDKDIPKALKEEVELDEGPSDTQDMYALMIKGMKAVPGSPKQKEIIKKINVIRKRMGMPLMKEELEATRMPMEAPVVLVTEVLKSKDKSVIDAFYKENSLVGRVLSTDGRSLEKHGVGGQTIAAWLKGKIAITAVSDVKSTQEILRYMKNTIPKDNFDTKSYKKFFEEVELDEEVFNWYIIKGNKEKGKVAHVGTERQLKLKIRKPTFPPNHVLAKSRKDLRIGDKWKATMGVYEGIELDEAVLAGRDYKYDGKVVKISKKNFRQVHKDFKGTTKGKETMLVLDPKSGGTILVPVQFEEVKIDEGHFQLNVGTPVAMKDKGKMRYGKVEELEKVMGKPGVVVRWSDGKSGRFQMSAFAGLRMDKKADYIVSEEVELEEMPNRANMEKINSLIKKYSGKFKWRDEVLYVDKRIEKNVTSLIKKGGLTATIKVSSDPMKEGFTTFTSYLNEGRPAGKIRGDDNTPTNIERQKLVDSQEKNYTLKDIESIARKHKVRLHPLEHPMKFGSEWTIITDKNIKLIYNKKRNDTLVTGWRIDKKKLRQYKDKYENEETRIQDVEAGIGGGRLSLRGFESAFEVISEQLNEEAPANATGTEVVGTGDDTTVWKKKKNRKNAKVKTEEFAGKKVFVVSPDKFWNARMGKSRYSRYEKYVGNDKLGEAIRQYGRENPKSPIILKNSENGAMLYLKYGGRI